MEQLEKIIRYLDGEVVGDEKVMFEKELNTNETITQTLHLVQEVNKTIADENLLTYAEKLSKAQATVNKEERQHLKIPFMSTWKILTAASVAILVFVSVLFYSYHNKPSNDTVFASFYQRYEADLITRSENPSEVSELIKAIQLYDKGNYEEAIIKFEAIIKSDATNTAARFFIGVSFIETKNFRKAIENLNYVVAQNDTVFIEHAEWYLALCFIKTNQKSQAMPLLHKIANGHNFYKIMASDVLRKMK